MSFTIIIGEEIVDSFEPSFEFKKWDEVRFKLTPKIEPVAEQDKDFNVEGDKIKYQTSKDEIHFYQLEESATHPEGGYEIEWILNEKPFANILSFDMETENLEFFYQPIYTGEEIAEKANDGNFVNPDAMGSYAVYYKDTPRSYIGGKNYGTGKVGQIYRPLIDDSAGNQTYGELNIDVAAKKLTVTIPQDFLDNAVYPIYHASGLVFGYQTIGTGGTTSIENVAVCSNFTMGTNNGAVDSITVYSNPSSTARTFSTGIYLHSSLAFVTNSNSGTQTPAATGAAWRTASYSPRPSLTGATDYLLCEWGSNGSGTHVISYDAGSTDQGHTDSNAYSGTTWADPMVPTHNNNKYSIYATYTPVPDAPTNVAATDGTYTDKVTITWTQSPGATDYHVWRDSTDLGSAGDVATFDDNGAAAPTITAGTASATDGSATDKVTLSISGASANNGTTYTYKVVASNAAGNSADSATDTGYRGVGSLTYQWSRSSGDADSGYSTLSGATTAPYDDTTAPAPTITAGTAAASDGTSTVHVALSVSGQSANSGAGRYFYATLSATGASPQDTNHDRGYIGVGSLTYQWQRSAADSDASYGDISGATSASYNDTGAPADGSGRYFKVVENATGATQQISASDRGYRLFGSITVDIVNGSYVSVGSPTMAMGSSTFSLLCQTVTGSFGTASEQIYVNNNNGANNGWTLTVAAQAATNVWDSAGSDYDFNDPTGSGCTDGGDADSLGGQMTINPSAATLAVGQCGACSTANISKGASAAFNEGTTDSITMLTATASSDDVGDWTLRGVSISQKIPAEQPAASDYDINIVLTVTAS